MKKQMMAMVSAACVPLMFASSAIAAAPAGDAAVRINSNVPVPGGFTAGSWSVSNLSDHDLPAGTTFLVTFEDLSGGPARGSMTLTQNIATSRATILKLNTNQFRITIGDTFRAGNTFTGYWSDSHGFSIGRRDKVTISLESLNGGSDSDSSNNVQTYDNGGRGF